MCRRVYARTSSRMTQVIAWIPVRRPKRGDAITDGAMKGGQYRSPTSFRLNGAHLPSGPHSYLLRPRTASRNLRFFTQCEPMQPQRVRRPNDYARKQLVRAYEDSEGH